MKSNQRFENTMPMIIFLYLSLLFSSEGQDTFGSGFSIGCKVSSYSGVRPDTDSFCSNSFECQSGFYKLQLNQQTHVVRTKLHQQGGSTTSLTDSWVCVSDCSARGTHFSNLSARECQKCSYPCTQCDHGECVETCSNQATPNPHCFDANIPVCHTSDDDYFVTTKCEFGCPKGTYLDNQDKTCYVCYEDASNPSTSCSECNGPLSTNCTACKAGSYLSYFIHPSTNKQYSYGECVAKQAPTQNQDISLLVSHRVEDRNSAPLEVERSGSSTEPFTDLRSALNKADQLMASITSTNITITIYLSKGPHYITLNETYYKAKGHNEQNQRDYRLIIRYVSFHFRPLNSSSMPGVTDPTLVTPDGDKVVIYNKLGAYFHLQVPHTLELYDIVFDGIDSQSQWDTTCLNARQTLCNFDGATVSNLSTATHQCGCSAPTEQTLNNCIMHLPTSFIKISYKRNTQYSTPKRLIIDRCVFQHFFYSLNAVIDIPQSASIVSITNTDFLYFSTCGSAIKNINRQTAVINRLFYPNGKLSITSVPQDEDVYTIESEAFYEQLNSLTSCTDISTASYGPDCHNLVVKNSSFKYFDIFFLISDNQEGKPNGQATSFFGSDTIRYRAPVLHFESYNGYIELKENTFNNIYLSRRECYFDTNINLFNVTVTSTSQIDLTYSDIVDLKVQNPVIITENTHGLRFDSNYVSESSGTKGFLYLTVRQHNVMPSLIRNNSFIAISGFYGSGAIHATLFQPTFSITPTYETTCGGLTISENLFHSIIGCTGESPIVRIDCTTSSQLDSYRPYQFETSTSLSTWTNLVQDFTDQLVALGMNSQESLQVSSRSVALLRNAFVQCHRASGGSVILIKHIPSVKIQTLELIETSSMLAALLYPGFVAQFGPAFGFTGHFSQFYGVFTEPGSLIEVKNALWVEMDDLKLYHNIMTNLVTPNTNGALHFTGVQFKINITNLDVHNLQSTECSYTFFRIYNYYPTHCSLNSLTNVNTPVILLQFANTYLTPELHLQNITLQHVNYQTSNANLGMFIASTKETSMQIYMKNVSVSYCDFLYAKMIIQTASIIKIEYLRVRNTIVQSLFTISEQLSYQKQLHIMGIGLESVQCDDCFHFVQNVKFILNITGPLNFQNTVNNLNFTSSFLHSASGQAYGSQIHVQNIDFTNLLIPRQSTVVEPLMFYLMQDGTYNLTNLNVQFRPDLDHGQFMYAEFQSPTTIYLNSVTIRNSDFTYQRLGKPVFQIVHQFASVVSNNTRVEYMSHNQGDAIVFVIKGAKMRDSYSNYIGNSGPFGGVYRILQTTANVQIFFSTFAQNQGVIGGAISMQAGYLYVFNSTFEQNRAEQGGAISSFGIGRFTVLNCSFYRNEAQTGSAINSLSNINLQSYIADSKFELNHAYQQSTLDFTLTQVVLERVQFEMNFSPQKTEGISAIKSVVTLDHVYFRNDTVTGIYNEITGCYLYFAENTVATIRNSKFIKGKSAYGGAIAIYSGASLVVDSQCIFFQNEANVAGGDIYAQNFRSLEVKNSLFSSSTSSIRVTSSIHKAYIHNNNFSGYSDSGILISATACELQFAQNEVYAVSSYYLQILYCDNALLCLVDSNTFSEIVMDRVISVTRNLAQSNARDTHQFLNNTFANITSYMNGGAIELDNVNGIISGNRFINVSNWQYDSQGGAIYIRGDNFFDVSITDNLFRQCGAKMGGAIAFQNVEPNIGPQVYEDNFAQISGQNLVSYAQNLVELSQPVLQTFVNRVLDYEESLILYSVNMQDISQKINQYQTAFYNNHTRYLSQQTRDLSQSITMKSGGALPTLYFAFTDNYGQIVHDYTNILATLQARVQSATGSNYTGTLVNYYEPGSFYGVFKVENVSLIAEPGTTVNITFFAFIDGTKQLSNSEVNHTITVNLNNCESGQEFLDTGECKKCEQGNYLFEAPTSPTPCLPCPNNAQCFQGNKIGPMPKFWRTNARSINFIQCFNTNACLGSSNDQNYDPKGTCADGYHGILCAQCEHNYVRNGNFQCAKCPPPWQNILLICIVGILMVLFLVILIKVTLKSMKERKSPFSAYFKILTNHFHLILLTASFDLSWPKLVADYFQSTEPIANVSDRIISIDCFLDQSTYASLPRPYLYLLIYVTMPLFIVGISFAIWAIIRRGNRMAMCNRTITTTIILLFLVHPSITTLLMRVFHCKKIDEESRLVRDLNVVCYTPSHLGWALGGALPGILIWGIGIPLSAFLFLYYSRTKLQDLNTKEKFGFLYNGYRERHYYWESVIMFRKVAMIFITVLLSSLGRIVQALAVILLLINFLFFTIRKKPYQTRRLNELEISSLLTSSITIYCGVFFLSHRDMNEPTFTHNVDCKFLLTVVRLTEETKWILVTCILVSNFIFFIMWIFFFLKDVRFTMAKMADKRPKLFLAFCLCCKRKNFKTEILRVKREEQDIEVINQIEDLESDLQHMKYMYIHKNFFKGRWEFEDLYRHFSADLDEVDKKKIKEKEYREIHSLEESAERQRHRKHVKQEEESSSQKRVFMEDEEKMKARSHLDHELELNVDDIKPSLMDEGKPTLMHRKSSRKMDRFRDRNEK